MGDFPASLGEVRGEERIATTFGWFPALFAGALIGLAAQSLLMWKPSAGNYVGIALFAAAGGALLFYEWWRRRSRLVMVRRGARVGIYRREALVHVTERREVEEYELNAMNTFKYLFIPACWTVAGIYLAVTPMERAVTAGERIAWLLSGIGSLAAVASLCYTRILCKQYLVPVGEKAVKQVVLGRAAVRRL